MNEKAENKKVKKNDSFRCRIDKKVNNKLWARNNPAQGIWFGLGMMGLVGWSVTIPTILGVMGGVWLDSHLKDNYSWTLMLLFAGLIAGCMIAWHWVSKESKEIQKRQEGHNGK